MFHDHAQIDHMFQALADPARRLMVERLSRGPASVSELAEPFDMSLSAVAQHIRLLQASGLIASEKIGRVRTCRIEPKALRTVEQWITERRTVWERRFDRLGHFLAEQSETKTRGVNHDRTIRRITAPSSSSASTTPRRPASSPPGPTRRRCCAGVRRARAGIRRSTVSTSRSAAVEISRFGPKGGATYLNETRYLDIVPSQRIVSAGA